MEEFESLELEPLSSDFETFIQEDVVNEEVGEVISVKDGMPLYQAYLH